MTADILTSLHGRKLGLGPAGELLSDRLGRGPRLTPILLGNLEAAGATLTDTTDETVLASITIPAGILQVGSLIQCRYQGIAPATNSTDTLTARLRLGGVAGTVLHAHTATDVANSNVWQGEYELAVRAIGASGKVVGCGLRKGAPAAEGTITLADDILAETTVDLTADVDLVVTGQWSVANAGNQCRVDFFRAIVF